MNTIARFFSYCGKRAARCTLVYTFGTSTRQQTYATLADARAAMRELMCDHATHITLLDCRNDALYVYHEQTAE